MKYLHIRLTGTVYGAFITEEKYWTDTVNDTDIFINSSIVFAVFIESLINFLKDFTENSADNLTLVLSEEDSTCTFSKENVNTIHEMCDTFKISKTLVVDLISLIPGY